MLGSLAEVRPEERKGVALAFFTLLGVLAGHTLLETARDALFLARLPASQLPWMYLAIAAVGFGLSRLRSRSLERVFGSHALVLLLLTSTLITLGFWLFGSSRSPWMLYALYIWSGLFGTMAAIRFWLVLSEIYTVTQAKRIYRLIGAGSVAGAILGAGVAAVITATTSASHLLLAAGILTGLTAVPAFAVKRPRGDDAASHGGPIPLAEAFRVIRTHPYVGPLAGLVLSSTMAVTVADYIFKSAVAASIPADRLGEFFALLYVVLNVLALIVQLLVVGPLLSRAGVHRALWVLPGLLIAGSGIFLAGSRFAAALWLKASDGTLRHSLNRTATELLYVPLSDALRVRVKGFIDLTGQRGGQALASVLILAPVVFVPKLPFLAFSLVVLAAVWILTAANLQTHYLDLFRSALREGAIVTRIDLPDLDLGSLEALFAALNSRDDGEVIAAMDLLAEEKKAGLVPALILYHPSPPVILRAFELFVAAGRTDFLPIADRLLAHPNPEIRAAALRARSVVQPDEEILRSASLDSSPLVSATAVVGLISAGWRSTETKAALAGLLASQSPAAGTALARAISLRPSAGFEDALIELAEAPEAEVLIHVADAMAAVRSERFFPSLLPMLAQREVRAAARAALLAHGDAALAFLHHALADRALPQELRRHLPRTISLFPPGPASEALLSHLLDEADGMVRFKILRGLGRLRANHPDVPLDAGILDKAISRTLFAAFRLVHWRLVLENGAAARQERRTPGFELLTSLLRDKEIHAVERLFRILGLRYAGEDFARIYRGVHAGSAKVRAGSLELLEHIVEPRLRAPLLALLQEGDGVARLAAAEAYYVRFDFDYDGLLAMMLEESSESLRCLVCHHVAELGLTAFRPRLIDLREREHGFFAIQVLDRALARLSPQAPAQEHV
jgi:ATP:ADP antiporter, AAA family